jgi:nucleoside 2-deoxyribosyltransferase
MTSIYVAGPLNSNRVRKVAIKLRESGYDAFDDWHSAGPHADEEWQKHEIERGRPFSEAIRGYHARLVVDFDQHHINRCDAFVLVAPAGKSTHIELGYAIGLGKPSFVLFDGEPDRYDVMYGLATCCFSFEQLLLEIEYAQSFEDVHAQK